MQVLASSVMWLAAFLSILVGVCGSFTRDIIYSTTECWYRPTHGIWEYRGDTLDGRPYYWKEIKGSITTLGKQIDLWLYYESKCDGKGDSLQGHPQWIVRKEVAPIKAEFDLDKDGACPGDSEDAGSYSRDPLARLRLGASEWSGHAKMYQFV